MNGSKVLAVEEHAAARGIGFTAFDYFAHGASTGAIADGTISRWRSDALAVLDEICDSPQILIGSSMGGWMALLAALARPDKVAGLVLIAPAADFTDKLMWAGLTQEARDEITEKGVWMQPSPFGTPNPITRDLIEDGRNWSLLEDGKRIAVSVPVETLQGEQDDAVPWRHALATHEALTSPSAVFTLIRDGDHRLSRPQDIHRLLATIERVRAQAESQT